MPAWKNFIFDLDKTLYSCKFDTQPLFDVRCIEFLKNKNITWTDAAFFHNGWCKKYQYNLETVEQECGFSVHDFMEYICDVDMSFLHPDSKLNELLEKLPVQKYIFTDSTMKHVMDTLRIMEINPEVFEKIYVSKDGGYIFKYDILSFTKMLSSCHLKAEESLLFEDNTANIIAAKQLKMGTVWINDGSEELDEADYKFKDILSALEYFSEN